MTAAPRVLVVEDEDAIRALLVAALRREPFEVDAAADGAAALQLVAANDYAVIILDLMMPRLNGFEFLDAFQAAAPAASSVVFVVTAFDDVMIGRLRADRVHAIVRKPFDVPQLVAMVREVVLTRGESASPSMEKPIEDAAPPPNESIAPVEEQPN
jgi:two-component system response regulator VanR